MKTSTSFRFLKLDLKLTILGLKLYRVAISLRILPLSIDSPWASQATEPAFNMSYHGCRDTRPRSLIECKMLAERTGEDFDELYFQWKRREFDERRQRLARALADSSSDEEEKEVAPKPKRQRKAKKIHFYCINENGERVRIYPRQSSWYCLYIVDPEVERDA